MLAEEHEPQPIPSEQKKTENQANQTSKNAFSLCPTPAWFSFYLQKAAWKVILHISLSDREVRNHCKEKHYKKYLQHSSSDTTRLQAAVHCNYVSWLL